MVHSYFDSDKVYLDSLSQRLNTYVDRWMDGSLPKEAVFKVRYAQSAWESYLIASLNEEYLTATKLNVILHEVLDEIEISLRDRKRKQKKKGGVSKVPLAKKQAGSKRVQSEVTEIGVRYNPFTKKDERYVKKDSKSN